MSHGVDGGSTSSAKALGGSISTSNRGNFPFGKFHEKSETSAREGGQSGKGEQANEKEIEMIKKMQHLEIMNQIGEAEPIFELPHKYAEGTDSPAWKRKQIRHQTLMKLQNIQENNSEDSVSLSDEDDEALPGQGAPKPAEKSGKSPKKKAITSIQDKLKEKGEKIKFQTEKVIKVSKFPGLFKYPIYE